jgi:hypothetical protein
MVFLTMLEKGKDACLPVGTKFTAYLNGDVALDRSTLERVQPVPIERKGPATVTIFAAGTGWWAHHPIYCGKVALAKIPRFSYLKVQLPPGDYLFRSEDAQTVGVGLKEGDEVYLQMLQIARNGVKGILIQVDNYDGEAAITHLKRIADEKITKISYANLAELQAAPELR